MTQITRCDDLIAVIIVLEPLQSGALSLIESVAFAVCACRWWSCVMRESIAQVNANDNFAPSLFNNTKMIRRAVIVAQAMRLV